MALKTQPVTWRLDTPVATRPPRGSEEKLHPVTSSRPTLVAVIWGQKENMSRSISYLIVGEKKVKDSSPRDHGNVSPLTLTGDYPEPHSPLTLASLTRLSPLRVAFLTL